MVAPTGIITITVKSLSCRHRPQSLRNGITTITTSTHARIIAIQLARVVDVEADIIAIKAFGVVVGITVIVFQSLSTESGTIITMMPSQQSYIFPVILTAALAPPHGLILLASPVGT